MKGEERRITEEEGKDFYHTSHILTPGIASLWTYEAQGEGDRVCGGEGIQSK